MAEKSKEAVSRTEAVTQALGALGKDAMPMQIKGFIKEKFGVEMSNNAVSAYKSEINRRAAKAKPAPAATKAPAPKPKGKSAPAPVARKPAQASAAKKPSSPKPTPATGSNGKAGRIELVDIQAIKNLVSRVGADQLKTLIDVLSK